MLKYNKISCICILNASFFKYRNNLGHKEMRSVNFQYIQQAHSILHKNNMRLSNKRLRRLAYFDVYLQNFTHFDLYNRYKKVVNSDASNNQMITLAVVIIIFSALIIIITKLNT